MKKRTKPSSKIVYQTFAGDKHNLKYCHHGLAELPSLSGIYPFLNLNELFQFALGSWKSRTSDFFEFNAAQDITALFNKALSQVGIFHSPERFNPHKTPLEQRLKEVPEKQAQALLCESSQYPKEHVFEDQYFAIKEIRGSNRNLSVIRSQPVYKGTRTDENIAENYAMEIARIIRKYPAEVHQIQTQTPAPAPRAWTYPKIEATSQKLMF